MAAAGGRVHVFSHFHSGSLLMSTSANFGQTFATTTVSNQSSGCCAHLGVSGSNVYVTWDELAASSGKTIRFTSSTNNGSTFNAPITLSDPADDSRAPQLAASGNHVHVTWHDQTTGDVMLISSSNGGATFGTASDVLTGAIGLPTMPTIVADGSSVYVASAPMLTTGAPVDFTSSTNSGGTFATPQVLNNSPLFRPECCSYPQVVAQGSGVYAVWTAFPTSSASNADVAFTYSTNGGADFSGVMNLSNSAEPTQLAYSAGSTYISKIDVIAVSSGRVHIVWFESASSLSSTIRYVTGGLIPSAVAVSSTGAASSTVTGDPLGNTHINAVDSDGTVLAQVILPAGSTAPSGTADITLTSAGLVDVIDVSGVNVPYPPGKSVSFLVDAATTGVCIDDQPVSGTVITITTTCTGANNIPYLLPCSSTGTSSGMLTFIDAPTSRTYTCTLLPGPAGNKYAVVEGLAFSAVASIVEPADAVENLIAAVDGMNLPKGIAQSLTAKLQAALKSIEAGRIAVAVNQLNAFNAEVKPLTGRQLSTAAAETLTSAARRIIETLTL
jgi:hypothetical protein